MIPELATAMLACTRIGAIHNIVFGGFSATSLKDRILDSECKLLVTADGGFRNGKIVPLKSISDEAITQCYCITSVIVAKRTKQEIEMKKGRDTYWDEEMNLVSNISEPEHMDAE